MFGHSETIQRLIIKRQRDAQWDQEHLSPHFKQVLGRRGAPAPTWGHLGSIFPSGADTPYFCFPRVMKI